MLKRRPVPPFFNFAAHLARASALPCAHCMDKVT
ncbi:hypothetical protein K788_00037655 [Paraburkholderia caribensis MBA4]|uniref:Uncharacterized protein n=1 Tax=Paraburkholderia caribensis MBA4 TaxID=1323664 RepID=A0A0P0RBA5_9BURK|nr:hypothetical protein K788_00037655 [Paraburkholderia caribensis MBA4]